MTTLVRVCFLGILFIVGSWLPQIVAGQAPQDNPVATYYQGNLGYPAWTDRIAWHNVIDMSSYSRGATDFERFENACDELAGAGGVLYYPAGTYDFTQGPFDGPTGRGLMLRSGVVIRGETPKGMPVATAGPLELPTKFVFGFKQRDNAVDSGERLTLELDGGDIRVYRKRLKTRDRADASAAESFRYESAPFVPQTTSLSV